MSPWIVLWILQTFLFHFSYKFHKLLAVHNKNLWSILNRRFSYHYSNLLIPILIKLDIISDANLHFLNKRPNLFLRVEHNRFHLKVVLILFLRPQAQLRVLLEFGSNIWMSWRKCSHYGQIDLNKISKQQRWPIKP